MGVNGDIDDCDCDACEAKRQAVLTNEPLDRLSGRDLDAAIAEHLLGWKLTEEFPDCNGQYRSAFLAPGGRVPDGIQLPPRGPIHRAWLVPVYHMDLAMTVRLAQRYGWKRIEIASELHELPTLILRALLKEQRAKTA